MEDTADESGPEQPTESQEKVSCDFCENTAVNSCFDCAASYCEDHVKKHLTVPKLKRHRLLAPTRDLEEEDSDVQIKKSGKASSNGMPDRVEEVMKNSYPSEPRIRKIYTLNTSRTILNDPVRRWTFGERDDSKTNRIIMLVGETGTGKTTLLNTLVNHALGVTFEDDLWFEITEEGKRREQTEIQTTHITVYDVFVKENPFSLTIIDTPGYGDNRGPLYDYLLTENLLKLFTSDDGVHQLDAIGFILKASMNRLSSAQHYIFSAVLSLFGKNVKGNIILLITHSNAQYPENALQAIKKAKIPCAKRSEKPAYFLFDNCQLGVFKDDSQYIAENGWRLGIESIEELYTFVDTMERKSLELTTDVLKERVRLQACVNNLIERIEWIELKQEELRQTRAAIEENKDKIKACENFTYEVDVAYKEKQTIELPTGSLQEAFPEPVWKYFNRAVCCTVCEETCHYPGCWASKTPKFCSAMRAQHCTSCTNQCHYDKHVKENWRYVIKIVQETRTNEDLKQIFEDQKNKGQSYQDMLRNAEEELEKETALKFSLVDEAYESIMKLQNIALASNSLFTLVYLDVLIEKMEEMNDTERVSKLKEMQNMDDETHTTVEYLRRQIMAPFQKIKKKATKVAPVTVNKIRQSYPVCNYGKGS